MKNCYASCLEKLFITKLDSNLFHNECQQDFKLKTQVLLDPRIEQVCWDRIEDFKIIFFVLSDEKSRISTLPLADYLSQKLSTDKTKIKSQILHALGESKLHILEKKFQCFINFLEFIEVMIRVAALQLENLENTAQLVTIVPKIVHKLKQMLENLGTEMRERLNKAGIEETYKRVYKIIRGSNQLEQPFWFQQHNKIST